MDRHTGYNYNTSTSDTLIGLGVGTIVPPAKVNQVRKPAETALFGDGEYKAGPQITCERHYRGIGPPTLRRGRVRRISHRGRTNVAFADAHVESRKDCFHGRSECRPGTGFPGNDNSLYDLD